MELAALSALPFDDRGQVLLQTGNRVLTRVKTAKVARVDQSLLSNPNSVAAVGEKVVVGGFTVPGLCGVFGSLRWRGDGRYEFVSKVHPFRGSTLDQPDWLVFGVVKNILLRGD